MDPIYTSTNCRAAYQLNWTLSVFWKDEVSSVEWLEPLKEATESDGVRILQHDVVRPNVSRFLVSTKPNVAPREFVRSVKGRLQYLVRDTVPKAFRRNYGFRSVGSAKRDVIESYVGSQSDHHRMADPRTQQRLEDVRIRCEHVDLSQPRRTAHAVYWHNLHIVFVNDHRYMEVRASRLRGIREMILKVGAKRDDRLSRAGILPGHVHLAVGCEADDAPADVALCYMNNLAFACGMEPVFGYGFYVGTFGEYDLGVTF